MDQLPLPLDRLVPDPDVEPDHHRYGQPEGGHNRHDAHVLVRIDELKLEIEIVSLDPIVSIVNYSCILDLSQPANRIC